MKNGIDNKLTEWIGTIILFANNQSPCSRLYSAQPYYPVTIALETAKIYQEKVRNFVFFCCVTKFCTLQLSLLGGKCPVIILIS